MNYIFDTSAIIVLIEICSLKDVLLKFSRENHLYVPSQVKKEFLEGSLSPRDESIFVEIFSIIPVELEEKLLPYFNFDSSDGAIWVISHGHNDLNCCCVIDEEFGRKISKLFNVKITGAIGIIIKMKEMGFLSNKDLQKIKERIRKSKFYYTEKLLGEFNK